MELMDKMIGELESMWIRKLIFLILLLLVSGGAWGATYYVNFDGGSDALDGTTEGKAWASLPGTTNGNGESIAAGDTIYLKPGTTYSSGDVGDAIQLNLRMPGKLSQFRFTILGVGLVELLPLMRQIFLLGPIMASSLFSLEITSTCMGQLLIGSLSETHQRWVSWCRVLVEPTVRGVRLAMWIS